MLEEERKQNRAMFFFSSSTYAIPLLLCNSCFFKWVISPSIGSISRFLNGA